MKNFIIFQIDIVRLTICALGFLTIIPLKKTWFSSNEKLSKQASVFPLAGFFIGCNGCLIMTLAKFLGFSSSATSFLTILFFIVLTGALHEDGLSDVIDAFWSEKTVSGRLFIMKDSRIGVFGGLALIFSVGLRVVFLIDLINNLSLFETSLLLISNETVSRCGMVWIWYALPLAKKEGIATKVGKPKKKDTIFAIVVSFIIAMILIIPIKGFISFIFSLCALIYTIYGFKKLCEKKINGYTGDTLGAIQQITSVVFLGCLTLSFY